MQVFWGKGKPSLLCYSYSNEAPYSASYARQSKNYYFPRELNKTAHFVKGGESVYKRIQTYLKIRSAWKWIPRIRKGRRNHLPLRKVHQSQKTPTPTPVHPVERRGEKSRKKGLPLGTPLSRLITLVIETTHPPPPGLPGGLFPPRTKGTKTPVTLEAGARVEVGVEDGVNPGRNEDRPLDLNQLPVISRRPYGLPSPQPLVAPPPQSHSCPWIWTPWPGFCPIFSFPRLKEGLELRPPPSDKALVPRRLARRVSNSEPIPLPGLGTNRTSPSLCTEDWTEVATDRKPSPKGDPNCPTPYNWILDL